MKEIEEIIINKNIKLTSARVNILEYFYKSKQPLCYEDLKLLLDMDKATFYRNIAKFEEEGILNSFESNDKKRYYEIRKTPHAHFICTKCSQIKCLENQYLQIDGYKIENIIIKGLCPFCSEN